MTEPLLYKKLTDIYDRSPDGDTYAVVDAVQDSITSARDAVVDFEDDLSIPTSDGVGLDRLGELFNAPRPPGLDDGRYRAVISLVAGARRGNLNTIKNVFEAASGLSCTVEDKQTNAAIPLFEIWLTPSSNESYGRGFYPEFPTNIDGYPVESSIAGVVAAAGGEDGGLFNDHAWSSVDPWTKALVDKVTMGGCKVVYKEQ